MKPTTHSQRLPRALLAAAGAALVTAPGAFAQFDSIAAWGNAAGTEAFTSDGTTTTVTSGGADFWGGSDQGAFVYDSGGAFSTTGDLTASVRHVSTDEPAPEWGRVGPMIRAGSAAAVGADATAAHWTPFRKSNGGLVTGRRPTTGANTYRATDIGGVPGGGYSSDENDQQRGTGNVATTAYWLSVARQGDTFYTGGAVDLGGTGTPGRWVTHWSTDVAEAVSGLQGGAEVTVGLINQSHPQSGGGGGDGINTSTYDNFSYSGSFDGTKFGPGAAGDTWQVNARLDALPSGAIMGAAFVNESGGAATGENTAWSLNAYNLSSFTPNYGATGIQDPTAMVTDDIVPASNFRLNSGSAAGSGLTADIYVGQANGGSFTANNDYITANPASGSTIIPNVDWTGNGGTSATNADQYNRGQTGDFSVAVPGSFAGANEENYGVDMTGQIFIEPNGGYTDVVEQFSGNEWVRFKDGIDDYTYLNIDGQVVIDDNNWTGYTGADNNGANLGLFDASDPKFDDGEWVDFRMIMWEGGGGDAGVLYSDMHDTTDTNFDPIFTPGAFGDSVSESGILQVGDDVSDATFATELGEGGWLVTLDVSNTGTSVQATDIVVVPEPGSIALLALAGMAFILRRRKR